MRLFDALLVLACGALPLVYAVLVRRRRPAPETAGRWAAAAAAALGLIVLFELGLAAGDSARYRVSLLGLRFYPQDVSGAPETAEVLLGGDYEEADVFVPGAGGVPVARLTLAPGDSTVGLEGFEDAASLLLYRRGDDWRILGARPFGPPDTVIVRAPGRERRLVREGDAGLRDLATGAAVTIPPPPIEGPRARLRALLGLAGRPSVWQRTYPLADMLVTMDSLEAGSLQGLTSFFYYRREGGPLSRDFRLMVADLDSEVDVAAPGAAASGEVGGNGAASGRAGAPGAAADDAQDDPGARLRVSVPDGSRVLVAGLPFRDYRELDLDSPIERYGIRPLASFELDAAPTRLDVVPSRPEVRVIRLGEWDGGPARANTVSARIAHAENAAARDAIVFSTPSGAFAALSEARLELSTDPSDDTFGIETPQGQDTWAIGEPFPLGQGLGRALLLRIDGQRVTFALLGLLVLLFAVAAFGFLTRPAASPIFPLALAGLGLVSIRLLVSYAIHLDDPFAQEPYQLSLWLVPLVPWTILGLWEAGARFAAASADSGRLAAAAADAGRRAGRWRWAYGLFGLCASLVVLGVFEPGLRTVVGAGLAFLPFGTVFAADLLGPRLARRRASRHDAAEPDDHAEDDPRPLLHRLLEGTRRLRFPGLTLGFLLLALRLGLATLGMREALSDQPRIGLGILYTPLAALGFAWVVLAHDRTLRGRRRRGALRRAVAAAVFDIGGYLGLAFVGTAFVVSDFGIALVGLPGLLLFLYLYGAGWVRAGGRFAFACFAAPLVLFVAIQASPALLSGFWETGVIEEDVRMREWKRDDLLLLERADFETLRYIGQRKSEALAVMRETMHAYTRGPLLGRGYLDTEVSDEIRDTVAREHAAGALVAGQWGAAGTLSLLLLLGAHLLVAFRTPAAPRDRAGLPGDVTIGRRELLLFTLLPIAVLAIVGRFLPGWLPTAALGVALVAGLAALVAVLRRARNGDDPEVIEELSRPRMRLPETIAVVALLLVVFAGVYMILANYGHVLFTGKNVYLLGLDSMGDALEYLALVGLAALALGWSGLRADAVEAGTGRLPGAGRVLALPRPAEEEGP